MGAAIQRLGSGALALLAGVLVRGLLSREEAGRAIALCAAGCAVVALKGGGSILSARSEVRLMSAVGGMVRREALRSSFEPSATERPDLAGFALHVQAIENGLSEGLLACLRAIFEFVPLALVMVLVGRGRAWGALLLCVPFAWLIAFGKRRLVEATRRQTLGLERVAGEVDGIVRHGDLWRAFGAEAYAISQLERLESDLESARTKVRAGVVTASALSEIVAATAILVLCVGVGSAPEDRAALVAFAAPLLLSHRPLRQFAEGRAKLVFAALCSERLLPLLSPEGSVRTQGGERRRFGEGNLRLESLRLRHGTGAPISASIPFGSMVAVVGPNGIGKTTLVRALLGLEGLASGQVLYGTENLTRAPAGLGSRPFAWVPQEPILIGRTVAENVTLGTTVDVADAFGELGLGELWARLAQRPGLAGLSGGEKQLVSLVRAYGTRASVLLLDEATSSLDAQHRELFRRALVRMRGSRTIIFVTHRADERAWSDQILELSSQGAVLRETGSSLSHVRGRAAADVAQPLPRPDVS
jgi:ABC-type multidrug transport system fused ATPase/permease subunit